MIIDDIFKANDIRGVVTGPTPQWDARGAWAIGAAFVDLAGLAGQRIAIGRDMRTTGEEMSRAFIEGALSRGADVLNTGLSSTDQLWFVSGSLNIAGIQFTASHNPSDYNGIKFCKPGAAPVDSPFLVALKDLALNYDAEGVPEDGTPTGIESEFESLTPYADHLHSLVPLSGRRNLRVVVDAGNGMAGHTVEAVLDQPSIEIIGLFLELDGTFPNHQPNPLEPENLVDAQNAVREHQADIGLVFDGDADRCFIIDEQGLVVTPSTVTALIAKSELMREPGATIVINSVTSATVGDVVAEARGRLVTSKVGHTYVKALMAQHNAIFGGEHSAHYYFRDFWGADTGMLAALHVLRLLQETDETMSGLVEKYERTSVSGEINSTVSDVEKALDDVAAAFERHGELDRNDGLRVDGLDAHGRPWWLNLRASNTEPLLRLNVEAADERTMSALRDDVLGIVRGEHDLTASPAGGDHA